MVYIFTLDSVDVGVVFLSDKDIYYYSALDLSKFADKDSLVYYVTTLAVRPDYQHQGIATQIIEFCGNLALKKGINYLRLDCNSKDEALVEFYKRRGFKVLGPMEKEPDYLLLEKIV